MVYSTHNLDLCGRFLACSQKKVTWSKENRCACCPCCLLCLLPSVLIVFFFHIRICQNWLLCQVCCQGECFAVSHKMASTSQEWCLSSIMFLKTADSNVFIFQLCLFFQQLSVQLFAFSFSHCFESNLQRFNSVHSCNNITSFKVTSSMTSWLAVSSFSWFKVIYLSSSEL